MLINSIVYLSMVFASSQFEHEIPGCPHNSACDKETGLYLKNLEKSFKKKASTAYLKKFGIPFEVWFVKDQYKGIKVSWDNHCAPEKNMQIGQVFTKNFKSILKKPDLLTRRAILQINNGKQLTFHMPRAHLPLYMNGKKLIFQKNINNHYYNISVSSKNELKVEKSMMPSKFSETVNCPKHLEAAFQYTDSEKKVLRGTMCQNVWDMKTKKYHTFITGWDCH